MMQVLQRSAAVLVSVLVLAACSAGGLGRASVKAGSRPAVAPLPPSALAAAWDAERLIDSPAALLDHDAVVARLSAFANESPDLFSTEEIGRSVEGRSLNLVSFGHGPARVLLWSQMHGDEPTATAALLDILEHVRRHRAEAAVQQLLDQLTIHVVPMLNPDGAARFQRRNAQGIDINRDALLLQTPEGRALKALRDRLNPMLGFNLHNQNWRTSAGRAGKPASISLLAVAMDASRTETPGRTLAKKACATIREAVESMAPGQVARYDDEFEVRAFGDNITKWGTPVVLIETGPYQGASADLALQRINFVAILSALHALATGRSQVADAARYESLPMNESDVFTVLVRRATLVVGSGVAPFTGDVGLASARIVRPVQGGREVVQTFRVDDLGDLRVFGAVEAIDAAGMFLVPSQNWREGDLVTITDWRSFKAERPLQVGTSTDLALLEPADGNYRVVRILPSELVLGRVAK